MIKTLCPLPWIQLHIDNCGHFKLCHNSRKILHDGDKKLNIAHTSSSQLLNCTDLVKVRAELISGVESSFCQRCWDQEKYGSTSLRKDTLSRYPSLDELYDELKLLTVRGELSASLWLKTHIKFGNRCNLKCIMCSPNSSDIFDDYYQIHSFNKKESLVLKQSTWQKGAKWINFFDHILPTLKHIRITGGEPGITKEHFLLLDRCIELNYASEISLSYNLNMTTLPCEMISYWKSFQHVDIFASIDGLKEMNEFIRYPSKWKTIERNLCKLDQLIGQEKNIKGYIAYTIQVYNVLDLLLFIKYLKKNYKNISYVPEVLMLDEPRYFCIKSLSKSIKNKIVEGYKSFLCEYVYDDYFNELEKIFAKILDFMQTEDWSNYQKKTITVTKRIEKIRKIKLPSSKYF